MLERGDYVPREKVNWSPRAVNVEAKYNTKEVWRDKDGQCVHTRTNICVGSPSNLAGGYFCRLKEKIRRDLTFLGGFGPPGQLPKGGRGHTTPKPGRLTGSWPARLRLQLIPTPAHHIHILR